MVRSPSADKQSKQKLTKTTGGVVHDFEVACCVMRRKLSNHIVRMTL